MKVECRVVIETTDKKAAEVRERLSALLDDFPRHIALTKVEHQYAELGFQRVSASAEGQGKKPDEKRKTIRKKRGVS